MDILAKFATDKSKEVEGVRHPMGPSAHIVVARWMNPAHAAANRAATAERELELELCTDEVRKADIYADIAAKAMAGTVLTGFSGLQYGGESIEYSVENAHKLLQIRDFRDLVYQLAVERAHFAVKVAESSAKNS